MQKNSRMPSTITNLPNKQPFCVKVRQNLFDKSNSLQLIELYLYQPTDFSSLSMSVFIFSPDPRSQDHGMHIRARPWQQQTYSLTTGVKCAGTSGLLSLDCWRASFSRLLSFPSRSVSPCRLDHRVASQEHDHRKASQSPPRWADLFPMRRLAIFRGMVRLKPWHTLNTNQMVGNVTKRLNATKTK